MKVLFMGTPDFAAVTLDRLIRSRHEIIGVVTQPDRQKGRGREVSCSPVKELALAYNLTVYQPEKVKKQEFLDTLRQLAPEVIVVSAFGQILPQALLEIPPYGCINVHGSLLPKYRGAAPIQYAILNGEKETGATIMFMDAGIDTGDILLQGKLTIGAEETGGSLFEKMAVLGADLLLTALDRLEDRTAVRTPQDNSQATYVKMLDKEMGRLDFTQPAVKLERYIRGFNPWPGAYTILEGKVLKLWKAGVEPYSSEEEERAKPGEIIEIRRDAIVLATGEDALAIRELQLEGKKRMAADAFLRGYPLQKGMPFGHSS